MIKKIEKLKQSAQSLAQLKSRHNKLLYFCIFPLFIIAVLIIVLPYRPKLVAVNNKGEKINQITPIYDAGEKPTFLIYTDTIVRESEKKQQFGTLFGQVGSIKAEVYGRNGVIADLEPQIESLGSDSSVFQISIPNERLVAPGKLSLRLQLTDNDREWVLWKDFRWNATILNFNQSSYRLGEDVQIAIGLLDSVGDPVCDAQINLMVTSPEREVTMYRSRDNTVIASNACASKQPSSRPDFSSVYIPTSEGMYRVLLEAKNGNETWFKEEKFLVTREANFTVRYGTTQTRIYSQVSTTLSVELRTDQAFDGEVYYDIPNSLAVEKINGGGNIVKGNDLSDTVVWPLSIKPGESKSFSFTFLSKNQTNVIFRTGPLRIVNTIMSRSVEEIKRSENQQRFISPYSWEFIVISNTNHQRF